METIGNSINALREDKNWSRWDLALASGVHEQNIRKYETDGRTPGTEMIEALAKALDVTPNDLMGWSELQPAKAANQ